MNHTHRNYTQVLAVARLYDEDILEFYARFYARFLQLPSAAHVCKFYSEWRIANSRFLPQQNGSQSAKEKANRQLNQDNFVQDFVEATEKGTWSYTHIRAQ